MYLRTPSGASSGGFWPLNYHSSCPWEVYTAIARTRPFQVRLVKVYHNRTFLTERGKGLFKLATRLDTTGSSLAAIWEIGCHGVPVAPCSAKFMHAMPRTVMGAF